MTRQQNVTAIFYDNHDNFVYPENLAGCPHAIACIDRIAIVKKKKDKVAVISCEIK